MDYLPNFFLWFFSFSNRVVPPKRLCRHDVFAYENVTSQRHLCIMMACGLLNVDLLHLDIILVQLRDLDDQDAVLQFGRDGFGIDLGRVGPGTETNLPLERTDLALVHRKRLEDLLISRPVRDTSNADLRLLRVPIDADILLLGAGQADMNDEAVLGIEDINIGLVVGILTLRAGVLAKQIRDHGAPWAREASAAVLLSPPWASARAKAAAAAAASSAPGLRAAAALFVSTGTLLGFFGLALLLRHRRLWVGVAALLVGHDGVRALLVRRQVLLTLCAWRRSRRRRAAAAVVEVVRECSWWWWRRALVPAAMTPSPWSCSESFLVGGWAFLRRAASGEEWVRCSLGFKIGDEIPEGSGAVVVSN